MALDPSIALGVRPLQLPDPLAQMAQVSQIQASQRQNEMAQMQLEQLKQDRMEMKDFQSQLEKSGGNPDLDLLAKTMLKSPKYFQQGVELTKKLKEQADFERVGKSLYPELFGAAPAAATAAAPAAMPAPSMMRQPAVAPAAPTRDMLGTGMYGMQPTNALAPNVAQAAPVNALAASVAPTEPTGKTADQLRREIIMFSQSGDPRAKAMTDMLKTQLTELSKAQTLSPGQQLYAGGKVVYTAPEKDSEFERLLKNSGLPDAEKTRLRIARAQKEATHAPGTTVTVSTEKKYGEAFGSKLADVDITKMTTAETAPAMAENANRIIGLVKQGDVFTGPIADVKLNLARALNVAGANNEEKIANTELLIAGTGQSTLNAIKGAGLGTGQGFTDKDLKFLQGIAGGTIGLTQKTLTDLATLQHRVATSSAAAWNKRVGEMPKEVVQGTGLSVTPIKVPPLSSIMGGAARPAGIGANWTFESDAAGNKAWVSPDRKSFKEAQ
jgi:hypothetical protein